MLARAKQTTSSAGFDRRKFLLGGGSVAAASTCPAAGASEPSEVITLAPPQRPLTDIESWNLGLLAPHRLACGNQFGSRTREAWSELGNFGRILIKLHYASLSGQRIAVESFLIRGNPEDSGNLKGFLRKFARERGDAAFIYKGYYRDAELHALKALPGQQLADKDHKSIGRFRVSDIAGYLSLLLQANASLTADLAQVLRDDSCSPEISFWTFRQGMYMPPRWVRLILNESGVQQPT